MKKIVICMVFCAGWAIYPQSVKPKFRIATPMPLALGPGRSVDFQVDVSLPQNHSLYLKTSMKGLITTHFSLGKNPGFELAERSRPTGYEKDGQIHLDGQGKNVAGSFKLALFETAGRSASKKVFPIAILVKSQVCESATGTCYPPVNIKLPLKVKIVGQKKERLSAGAFRSTGVNWVDSLSNAQKNASEKNQNIFVIITAPTWCGYCIVLERDVFSKASVHSVLNSGIVPLRVTDKSPELRKFAFKGYPTMFIYSSAGKPVAQISGRSESGFLAAIKPYLKTVPTEPVLPDVPVPDHDHIVIDPVKYLPGEEDEQFTPAETQLLSENFPVWDLNPGVVNHGESGGTKKNLPTVNLYKEAPGCYVACYSKIEKGGVYSVGSEIYVHGQVRVPGKYAGRTCRPQGYETADISALPYFKSVCNTQIRSCAQGDCWAGGDTGGWFGVP